MRIIRSAIGSSASLGFLKFLKENGFHLIGTDITELCVGKFITDEFYLVPRASDEFGVVERYAEIAKKTAASWIISGPETEIEVLLKHQNEIPTPVFHLPYDTFKIITDKYLLSQFLVKSNIKAKCPLTVLLKDVQLTSFQSSDKLVLKPSQGRGSRGVVIIKTSELKDYKDRLTSEPYVVQPFLNGKEYTVDTLHDFEGKVLNIVPRERLVTESGISTVTRTVKEDKLIEAVVELSSVLKFSGANCMQFIQQGSEFFLTDVNPRFGGGSILSLKASDTFAQNVIHLLKNEKDKLKYNSFDYKELTMLRGYDEYYQG